MAKNRRAAEKTKSKSVELLLTQAVPHLGQQGEVVSVRPGYARNYLLPNGLATVPTPHMLRLLEKHRAKVRQIEEQRVEEFRQRADALARHSLTIEANANEEGHLYGSVTADDISAALQKDGFPVAPEQLRLSGPLKELGLYTIHVQLVPEVETEVKLWVVPTQVSKKGE